MKLRITQYGLSEKAGGWDGVGDSGTDEWQGNENNTLNTSSCALSPDVYQKLGTKDGDVLRVVFNSKYIYYKEVADSTEATLTDRLDVFNPYDFDKMMDRQGEYADVTIFQKSYSTVV